MVTTAVGVTVSENTAELIPSVSDADDDICENVVKLILVGKRCEDVISIEELSNIEMFCVIVGVGERSMVDDISELMVEDTKHNCFSCAGQLIVMLPRLEVAGKKQIKRMKFRDEQTYKLDVIFELKNIIRVFLFTTVISLQHVSVSFSRKKVKVDVFKNNPNENTAPFLFI